MASLNILEFLERELLFVEFFCTHITYFNYYFQNQKRMF